MRRAMVRTRGGWVRSRAIVLYLGLAARGGGDQRRLFWAAMLFEGCYRRSCASRTIRKSPCDCFTLMGYAVVNDENERVIDRSGVTKANKGCA